MPPRAAQVDSFETTLSATFAPGRAIPAVFIRAPVITRKGAKVEVLSQLDVKSVGLVSDTAQLPVAVQQGSLLGIAFHPGAPDGRSPTAVAPRPCLAAPFVCAQS